MISQTLKCSVELLKHDEDPNIQSKRQWTVKFPTMEETLAKWILTNQERISISGISSRRTPQRSWIACILAMNCLSSQTVNRSIQASPQNQVFPPFWWEWLRRHECRQPSPPRNPPAAGPVCVEGHLQYGWNWLFLLHAGLGHLLSNCDLRLGFHLFFMLTLVKHFQFQVDNSFATKQLEGRK